MSYWDPPFFAVRVPPPEDGPRRQPRSKRPHRPGTVEAVRRLYETTDMTYVEIAGETGVAPASVCRWAQAGRWTRPSYAPVATSTGANGLPSSALKGRALAVRLRDLAERMIREMEAAPAVDMGALAGALDLLRQAGAEERRKRKGRARPEPGGDPAAAHAAGRATLARAFPAAAPEAPLPEPPLRLKKRAWGRAALIPFADTLPSPHKDPVSPIVRRPGRKTFR